MSAPINDRILEILKRSPTAISTLAIALGLDDDRYKKQAITPVLKRMEGIGLVESEKRGNEMYWAPIASAPIPLTTTATEAVPSNEAAEEEIAERLTTITKNAKPSDESAPLTTECGICQGEKAIYDMDQLVSCPGCAGEGTVPTDRVDSGECVEFIGDHGEYTVHGHAADIERLRAHVAALKDMLKNETLSLEVAQFKYQNSSDQRDLYADAWARIAAQLDIQTPNAQLFDLVFDKIANLLQQHRYLKEFHDLSVAPQIIARAPVTAADFLNAASTTLMQRAIQRDKAGGERSMSKAVAIYNAIKQPELNLMTEEDGWLFMVALKLGRATNTSRFNPDDFIDMAGYVALAGECFARGEAHAAI